MRSSDELDLMLDKALSSYCDVEPRAGIEKRVLVRARGVRRRSGWLWFVPVPLVLVLVVAFEFRTIPPVRLVVHSGVARAAASAMPAEVRRVVGSKPRVRRSQRAADLPRKDVFPTPTPLTKEEEAMVLLASRHPDEARTLAVRREIEPIKIPDLRIDPLQSDGE